MTIEAGSLVRLEDFDDIAELEDILARRRLGDYNAHRDLLAARIAEREGRGEIRMLRGIFGFDRADRYAVNVDGENAAR